ncbi:tetratricopeptide repeat protein [Floridanema evergladense]|uniref:Tetratricopeptide repeat protein n=1 Tax=Floridaenema evergladense BLCC-F167 TaxID=3153639 RepID=A0ABV4WJP2_9CYAN
MAFVGRDKQLTELHQLLQKNSQVVIAAINGMGGVGKTELAIQYATQHLLDYPGGICWVNAQGLLAGLQILRFAEIQFNIVPPDDWELADKLQYCWQKWQPGNVLFIFDDVFNYKQQVKPFLPNQSRFKVLLTTRFQFDSTLQQLRLDVLKPLAAMRLLKSIVGRERLKQEPKIARSLCQFLGYLPLALELVGRYLDLQPNLSLARLLRRLEKQRLEHAALIAANPLMRYEFGVEEAINLSWEQLDENAKNVGCYLSLFALAAIPFSTDGIEDEDEQEAWEKALRDLQHWHLLQEVRQETYRLHPLIRQFLQKRLDELTQAEEMKRNFAAQIVAVAKQIKYDTTRDDIIKFSPWIPHLEELMNLDSDLIQYLKDEDIIKPFTGLGWFYEGQSFYQQAEVWLHQCVEVAKRRLGEKHSDFSDILNNLANLYCSQGRYSEAEPLYKQALEIDSQSLQSHHLHLARHLNNLAALYSSQGRYSEAEPLYKQALEIDSQSLPENHSQLAIYLNNLANLYYFQGRYSEAEPLYKQALEIDRQSLPENHPSIATHLNNLAGLYESQGRYSEAEPLYLQALSIHRQSLPENHPSLATHLNNLAGLYESQGRYSEAEPLYLQALSIDRQSLPENHPELAAHLNNLAELYRSQGRYSEAEPLYLQALSIDRQSLPENHPSIATHLNNLAELYRSQGRYSEAEPLYTESLNICESQLGVAHRDTITVRGNYAEFLRDYATFLKQKLVESGADLEVLQKNPLFLEIMREFLPENLPNE